MDEQQFRKTIIQVRALAKSQHESVSKEQVHARFLPLNVSEDQFVLIYKYLTDEKVKLFETEAERLEAEIQDKRNKGIRTDAQDSEYLKMYIEELNDMDMPAEEERNSLIGEVLNSKDRAVEVLPVLYLRNVVDIARLYTGQGVAVEDLIGEGNVGVLTAAGMLDLCETVNEVDEFMIKTIMDSMESLIMEKFTDSDFDLKVAERVNDLNDKAKEMAEDLERLVTVEELVNELETDEEYIRETIRLSGNSIEYIKQ
ncbi:MAG: hypothetical protein K6E53_12670 [Lachnospiraceae bacterium]|nr:hypothetical protein [Lachnospiraceae bacterium]